MKPTELSYPNRVIWFSMFVPATISLVAGVYTLVVYAMFPRLWTPVMHLVILQTVAQLLFSLAFNVAFYNPPDTGSFACGLQGFLINFSMLSSILYTAFISGFMVSSIKLKRRVQLEMRTLVLLTICIVIFASAMAAMPFISDQYVNMGARCWIAEDEEGRDRYAGVMYRFLTHYVIVWAANIFIFASYFSIIKYLKMSAAKRTAYSDDRLIQRTIGTLLYYPAICFVVWTPVTCIRVFTAIDENLEVPIWAYGIAFSIAASEGAFFAIVFSQYRSVRFELYRMFFGEEKARLLVTQVSSNPAVQNALHDDQKKAGSSAGIMMTAVESTIVGHANEMTCAPTFTYAETSDEEDRYSISNYSHSSYR